MIRLTVTSDLNHIGFDLFLGPASNCSQRASRLKSTESKTKYSHNNTSTPKRLMGLYRTTIHAHAKSLVGYVSSVYFESSEH